MIPELSDIREFFKRETRIHAIAVDDIRCIGLSAGCGACKKKEYVKGEFSHKY
jgi:hypothetical protein